MSKPIKDRGIKWVETYGDKSAYLKKEFEEQVGPGSYFRWEGHDNTTGNDYYVVVAPGYSKKQGYHFFAGLRKMPADHGASGKYFNSMREAIHYAYETWRVPKPDTMPPQWAAPTIDQIQDKEIVLEGAHESSAASQGGIEKASWVLNPKKKDDVEKTSMSLQQMRRQFDPRMGPKILPEQYCWAYRASPVTGFLPALYSRLRFSGVDGQNFNPREPVQNLLYDGPIPGTPQNKPEERPPLLATCEEPAEEVFNQDLQGSVVSERLYTMPKTMGQGRSLKYAEFKAPYEATPGQDNAIVHKWKDAELRLQVSIPPYVGEDFLKQWNDRFLAAYRQSLTERLAEAEAHGSSEKGVLRANLDRANKLEEILVGGEQVTTRSDRKFVVTVFADDIKMMDEFSRSISDQVRQITGNQHRVQLRPANKNDSTTAGFMKLYQQAEKIVASGDDNLIDRYGLRWNKRVMDPATGQTVNKEMVGFNFDQAYAQEVRLSGSQLMVYDDLGMPMGLSVDNVGGWMQEANTQRAGRFYVLKDPIEAVNREVPGFVDAYDSMQRAKTGPERSKAREYVVMMLNDYKALASTNKLSAPLTSKDVYDSKTVCPKLTNPITETPKTDAFRLPVGEDDNPISGEGLDQLLASGQDKIPGKSLFHVKPQEAVSPFYIEATRDNLNQEPINAARWYDPKSGGLVYGRLPEGVQPRQLVNGIPTLTPNATMAVGGGGETYSIKRNEVVMYDPNSRGKFIPGNLYDIDLAPISVSPKADYQKVASMSDGFQLKQQMHLSEWDEKNNRFIPRFEPPGYLTKKIPEEAEGKAAKVGNQVTFFDNVGPMQYLKRQFDLPNNLVQPFTPLTTMDLKVIMERAQRGQRFYQENQATYENWQGDPSDPGYQEYVYGKTISECSGNSVPAEVLRKIKEAKENPEAALQPKEGELWGLKITPAGGTEADAYWYGDPNIGPMLSIGPDEAEVDSKIDAVQKLKAEGATVTIERYTRGDRNFALPSLMTSKDEEVSYVQFADENGEQDFVNHLAMGHMSVEERMRAQEQPEPEEVPVEEPALEPEPEPTLPEPVPSAPPQPEPAMTAPEPVSMTPEPIAPQPPSPATPQAPPRRRGVEVTVPPKKIDPSKLFGCADSLVKLADRYDREGRRREADLADNAIRFLSIVARRRNAKNNNQDQ